MQSKKPPAIGLACEATLASLGVGLWDWTADDDRMWVDARAATLLGEEPGSVRIAGSSLFLRCFATDAARLFEAIDAALLDGRRFRDRFRFQQPDGGVRWWEVHATPQPTEGARRLLGGIRDVHEEEDRLRRSQSFDPGFAERHFNDAIDGCIRRVTHDFKNALQIVRGYVAFAKQAAPDSSELKTDLEHALAATDRAHAVAQQFAFCRKRRSGDAKVCDVNEVLAGLAALLKPIVGAEIELSVAPAAEPLEAAIDEASLRQTVFNLTINARDAMPRGGRVLIRAERFRCEQGIESGPAQLAAGEYVRIFVTDSGVGLAGRESDRAFEPFYSTKPCEDATGLGLTIVRQLATENGGAAWLHSEPSVGTTATVLLPLTVEAPRGEQPANGPFRILAIGETASEAVRSLDPRSWEIDCRASSELAESSTPRGARYDAVLVDSDTKRALRSPLHDSATLVGVHCFDPEADHAKRRLPRAIAALATPIDGDRLRRVIERQRRRIPSASGTGFATTLVSTSTEAV